MFKFKSIELYQWDYWKHPSIPLDEQIITIVGPNGSGKTTFLDSLRTLLNIKQSKGRDVHKYLRQDKVAIKAVVTNEAKTSHGNKPFAPHCQGSEVTLAITFQKRKGENPKKRFFILNGNVPLEQIISKDSNKHDLGSNEYSDRLRGAGLSKSVLKVLALEQGKTDDLCAKKPNELLELVFDVFGDLTTIKRYEKTLTEQRLLEEEMKETEAEYKREAFSLEQLELNIEKHKEYVQQKADLETITYKTLVQAKTVEGLKAYEKHKESANKQEEIYESAHKARIDVEFQHKESEESYKKLSDERSQLDREKTVLHKEVDTKSEVHNKIERNIAGFVEIDKHYKSLESKDLEELQKKQKNLESLYNEHYSNEIESRKKVSLYQTELKELEESENSDYTPVSASIQKELESKGIHAKPLCKLIDIKDEKWQSAIESLLGNDRFNLIVDEIDHFDAMEIARERKYRSFISKYESEKYSKKINKGSALFHVELSDKRIPFWILNVLNNTCLVESLSEAKSNKDFDRFITVDGYHYGKERGGRSVSVRDKYCGKKAVRDRINELQKLIQSHSKEHALIKTSLEEVAGQLNQVKDECRLVQNWQKMSEELNGADEKLETLKSEIKILRDKIEEYTSRIEEINPQISDAYERESSLAEKLGETRGHEQEEDKAYKRALSRFEESKNNLNALYSENDSFCWYPDMEMDALKVDKVNTEIALLEGHIQEYEEKEMSITDQMIEGFDKRKSLLSQKQKTLLDIQEAHKEVALRTNQALEAYVKSLNNSVKFYKQNVEDLAEVANAEVTVKMPHFDHTIDSIRDAGIEISFAFDGKKLHKLNSGESSGGQKVIESLILLIALLKDDRDSEGGFVFIDEPFAHLDVVNVDRVGRFLEKTGSQYILTTPNTQNIGVFRPSKLMIATQKKHANQEYANRPKFGKRRMDGSLVLE